jgi:ABC-type multidrug transport system fused ATPase/permease subunit
MESSLQFLDPYFIWMYRLSGYTFADFLVGTFLLALMAVVIGELTISVVFLLSRRGVDKINAEVVKYYRLSEDALSAGDRVSYKATNKLANDAFGKWFFMQFGLSAAFIWPIFFVLAWMQTRFADVEFPLFFTQFSLGYVGVFITLFAAAYMTFKRIKYRIPYFKRIKKILDLYDMRPGELNAIQEIFPTGSRTEVKGL